MNLICIIDIWKILILTWKILILESFLNSDVIFNDSWFWFGIPESVLRQVYEILLSCEPLGFCEILKILQNSAEPKDSEIFEFSTSANTFILYNVEQSSRRGISEIPRPFLFFFHYRNICYWKFTSWTLKIN